MPEQELGGGGADASEEVASDNNPASTNGDASAPLNREQRRAQAKGKKNPAAFNPAVPNSQNMRGQGTHGPGTAGGVRLPRRSGGK